MFNYHFHYVGLCLMQADDLFQKVPVEGTTKGPQPTKYDSGFGSEPTSKTEEPGAHLPQLHQQPPDPGIQEGGTSDEDYGLEETGKANSPSEMVRGNISQSHARKVEQNEGKGFKILPNRLNNKNYCTVPNWFMVKQWHTMSESMTCIII